MTWNKVVFAASPEHNYVKDSRTALWRRDDGGLYPLDTIIDQGARPIRSVTEILTDEAVERAADRLYQAEHGEPMAEHHVWCQIEGCTNAEDFRDAARTVLAAAIGVNS